jgi:hypothetical protein
MEGLTRLVSDSLARHGFHAQLDHRRLPWSKWFRCESSFSLLLVPGKPGIFAMAEEILAPGETAVAGGKRMLAVFEVEEAQDLGMALARQFAPGSAIRERIDGGRCFARYVVIEDAPQRRSAAIAFRQWLSSASEPIAGSGPEFNTQFQVLSERRSHAKAPPPTQQDAHPSCIEPPAPLPSGF